MLFPKFYNEIQSDNFLKSGDEVVVAVSGGSDSVCLLDLMVRVREKMNLKLTCAHVNHNLRPEADDDEAFVRDLCKKLGVSFVSHNVDVAKFAQQNKMSIELAGREVRYAFFTSLGKDAILTAHTKNDAAETVLLHLTRGCGLKGLCGIPRLRNGKIYRPLLSFSKKEIESYLQSHSISWREDSTNQDSFYARNKIRNEILPKLLEMNPAFLESVEKMTAVLQAENCFLENALSEYAWKKEVGDNIHISISSVLNMSPALQTRALSKVFDSHDEIMDVLSLMYKENGKRISVSHGRIAEKDYNFIVVFQKTNARLMPIKLPLHGEVIFGNYIIKIGEEGIALPKDEYTVRCRQNGDFFSPEGISGHKKIKDFLSEKKIPLRLRDEIPIITLGDKIVSVSDMRRDNAFVPKDNNVIHINIQPLRHV